MIYIKWLLMLPVMIILTVLTFPLAFVLPMFVKERIGCLDNGTKTGMGWYLKPWLNWFQTPDNSIDGDEGWRTLHWQWRFKFPAPVAQYLGRLGWLWRNPAYGFGCVMLEDFEHFLEATYIGNPQVNDKPGVEGYCLVHARGLFQLVWVKRIGSSSRCIYVVIGWNIKGLLGGNEHVHKASYAFSPRISGYDA